MIVWYIRDETRILFGILYIDKYHDIKHAFHK